MPTKKKQRNLRRLVPPDSFLGLYLEWCDKSETPVEYDFWTGMWVLSSALGRGVTIDRPGAPVFLNLFCILVAESGVTRKSTAVRRANKVLREHIDDQALVVEGRTTQEALEVSLGTQTLCKGSAFAYICIDELVKFLGREKYVQTLPTFLTDVYDCPELRYSPGTITRGSVILKDVFVTFLSASTPSWLVRAVNPDVIEGGFTSRVVFVVAEQPKRLAPWPATGDSELRSRLNAALRQALTTAKQYNRISINDNARKRFEKWYRNRKIYRDPFRASFQSREDGHVLRLAGLLCINDGTLIIQVSHIEAAISIITQCREDGAKIFEGTGTNSAFVLGIDALRDKLLAAGLNGCKQGELSKTVARYMKADEMCIALDIMHELGMVQRFEGIQLGRGRAATIWRGTSALASSKALDYIIEERQRLV